MRPDADIETALLARMSHGTATVRQALTVAGVGGLAALALRLINVGDPWHLDEASTLLRYVEQAPGGLWRNYDENNHLLASALAAALRGVGLSGEVALRQIAIVPSVIAVVVLGYWCSRRRGWPGGLLASAALAVTPVFMLQSSRLRGYGLALLGVTLLVLALAELRQRQVDDRRLWWVAAGGATLAVASWPLAALPAVAALGAGAVLLRRPPPLVPLAAAAGLLTLWWLPVAGQMLTTLRANGRLSPGTGGTTVPFRYSDTTVGSASSTAEPAAAALSPSTWLAITAGLLVAALITMTAVMLARRGSPLPPLTERGRLLRADLIVLLAMTVSLMGFLAPRGLLVPRFTEVLVPALGVVLAGLVPDRRWVGAAVAAAVVPIMAVGAVQVDQRRAPLYEAIVREADGADLLFVLTPNQMPGFQAAIDAVPGSPQLRVVMNPRATSLRQVLPEATTQMRITPAAFFEVWCRPDADLALVQRVRPRQTQELIARMEAACDEPVPVRRHREGPWLLLIRR